MANHRRFIPKENHMSAYLMLGSGVIASIALFARRAVYIDEHIFLSLAQSALKNWLFLNDMDWLFFGTYYPLWAHTHPPVGEYYLAGIYALLGQFREVPFRLLYSVFAIGAAMGFYCLAQRFTQKPVWVTVLFLASPVFVVMAPTLMMDVPMLAFLLVGLACYLRAMDGRSKQLPAAAICFALALGCGYTALVPLACIFLVALAGRRPKSELIAVAVAPVALAAWLVIMSEHLGKFMLGPTFKYLTGHGSMTHNILALPSFLGGVTLFPWSFLLLTETRRKSLIVITSLLIASGLSWFVTWSSLRYGLWYIFLASSGIGLLVLFWGNARQLLASGFKQGEGFLLLWFPATSIFFIIIGEMINARYMLLGMPALYLVIFRNSTANKLALALVPTLLLSLVVAVADYRFVDAYRSWVSRTIVPLQDQGFRVWGAAESGLRFYLERRGIPTLATSDLRPRGEDLVVRHASLFRYSLSPDVETMLIVLKTFDLNDPFPVRTFNQAAGAGFHDSRMGMVPFSFSRAALDRLEIAEVSPFVDRLPVVAQASGAAIPVWSPQGVLLEQVEPELSFAITPLRDTQIEYELEGKGAMEVVDGRVRLHKMLSDRVLWRNFRVVPKQFVPVDTQNLK